DPFSADSKRIFLTARGTDPGSHVAKVWDAVNGKELQSWKVEPSLLAPLVFSPDGKWVAGVLVEGKGLGRSARLKVWDSRGTERYSVPIQQNRQNLLFSEYRPYFNPGGNRLAVWKFMVG